MPSAMRISSADTSFAAGLLDRNTEKAETHNLLFTHTERERKRDRQTGIETQVEIERWRDRHKHRERQLEKEMVY